MSENDAVGAALSDEEREKLARYEGMRATTMDLAEPHARYLEVIDEGGFFPAGDNGLALSFARADTEYIVRGYDEFSTVAALNLGNVRPLIPLNVDAPMHTTYRKLLDPLFSAPRMNALQADIARRANAFIDGFADRGECHFTAEFADRFPSSVFLGLMGLPEDELDMFLGLRDGLLHPERVDPAVAGNTIAQTELMNATGTCVYAYFDALIDERTAHPSDDIVSHFLTTEFDGARLTREDILDICYMLVLGGLDTVTDALTCFFAFLARSPEHRRSIVAEPSIIPAAVEELMRFESPAPHGTPRLAKCPVDLPGGGHLAPGTAVMPHWGAANVDPATFDDPMSVRFDRPRNPHFGFGTGVHRCLGRHLARRELRVTLEEWHRRIPEYRIKPGHEALEYPPGLRHVANLVLCWP